MISNIGVALLLGAGVGAWVYSKALRRTGGNTTNALVIAGIVGGLAALVVVFALQAIF